MVAPAGVRTALLASLARPTYFSKPDFGLLAVDQEDNLGRHADRVQRAALEADRVFALEGLAVRREVDGGIAEMEGVGK